ncbi:inositol-3-phosphate synthase [Atractiella rhizophila]|nr:inositol-3-phosphate synthase [Atractiella rhizophila]
MAPSIDVPSYTNGHANGVSDKSTHVPEYGFTPVDPTAARRVPEPISITSPNTTYDGDFIFSKYVHHSAEVNVIEDESSGVKVNRYEVRPTESVWEFKTERKVPKTGLMMVGWGGNNGSTLTATLLANKHNLSWKTKEGLKTPNYLGSLVRASTIRIGVNPATGKDVYVPFSDLLPMVHPNDLVIGGWDISGFNLDKAMERAEVLDWDLQRQVAPMMKDMKPLPSIYYPDFINANQEGRADNIIAGNDKWEHVLKIQKDIEEFKAKNQLDKVIVLWTANTERYSEIIPGVNDTAANLLESIKTSHDEVSPSTIFAVACILAKVPYINGAPQNTFVPGAIDLAEQHKALIGGDDFKSGQTKIKSVLAEFLVNAGIKPKSIASYNHLGNNDGWNLSAQKQFRSKEISKSSVVDDMVASNNLLYKEVKDPNVTEKAIAAGAKGTKTEHPDHIIVIKYVPAVGDTKKAIDEYNSEIMMHGSNVINIFNQCEDSLLASPLILDLTILAELLTRVNYRANGTGEFDTLHSVLGLLSYMLKAPLTKPGEDVINSLGRQRNALEAFLKACIGLQPGSDLMNFTYLERLELEKAQKA